MDPVELHLRLGRLARGDLRSKQDDYGPSTCEETARLIAAIRDCWHIERDQVIQQTLARIDDETAAFEREAKIFDIHPDGIVILNPSGEIARVNRAFLRLCGRTAANVTGVPLTRFVHDPERLCADISPSTGDGNAARDLAFSLVRPDGRRISVTGSRLERAIDSSEVVLIVRDMSETERRIAAEVAADVERRRARELERALREVELTHQQLAVSQERLLHADRLTAIGQMAAGVLHEVNNPAAFVMVNLDLLKDYLITSSRLTEPGADMAQLKASLADALSVTEESSRGVERIVSIVRDLKTFSRIEAAEIELVDVHELVEVATRMVRNELRHRGRLELDLAPVPKIAADRGKLAQMLVNLLINAVQALDEKTKETNQISVSVRGVDGEIQVDVSDNGCGIPEDVRVQVFEPFFTTKPREAGTGLGLSLSAEIVKSHGGEIRVVSELGVGTSFQVRLPFDTGLACTPISGPPTPPPSTRISGRILLIDDEPALCRALQRVLEPPHEVIYALGGREALTVLETTDDFDVVLCDLMMPGIDGPEVYHQMLNIAPHLAERTVFCTGGVFVESVRDFLESSGRLCLEKPVQTKELQRMVHAMVAARRAPVLEKTAQD